MSLHRIGTRVAHADKAYKRPPAVVRNAATAGAHRSERTRIRSWQGIGQPGVLSGNAVVPAMLHRAYVSQAFAECNFLIDAAFSSRLPDEVWHLYTAPKDDA